MKNIASFFCAVLALGVMAMTPSASMAEEKMILVPEGSGIICTLKDGCTEAGRGLDFRTRGRVEAQPTLLGVARSMMKERAELVLEDVQLLSPQQLLVEELARAVVRNLEWPTARGATWAAREYVFAERMCPIFEHYPDPARACWDVRAFEGSDAEHRGIPSEIMPTIRGIRTALFALGREHLRYPDNLQGLYQRMGSAMIDEFRRLSRSDQQDFIDMLEVGLDTLEAYPDPAVKDVLAAYYHTEQEWRRGNATAQDVIDANSALTEVAGDGDFLRFWHRRHQEGGPDLLATYLEVLTDLRKQLWH